MCKCALLVHIHVLTRLHAVPTVVCVLLSHIRGLYHPSVQDSDGKWLLDLKSRYLWEDVPHGLVAMKGVAQLMGVPTPSIDK